MIAFARSLALGVLVAASPFAVSSAGAGEDARQPPRLIALLTRADWCSVCKANGPRAGKVLMEGAEKGEYSLVINDVSDEATAAKSQSALNAQGLTDVASGSSPGTIAFVDRKSGKRVAEITVAHQDGEIRQVIELARQRVR